MPPLPRHYRARAQHLRRSPLRLETLEPRNAPLSLLGLTGASAISLEGLGFWQFLADDSAADSTLDISASARRMSQEAQRGTGPVDHPPASVLPLAGSIDRATISRPGSGQGSAQAEGADSSTTSLSSPVSGDALSPSISSFVATAGQGASAGNSGVRAASAPAAYGSLVTSVGQPPSAFRS